MAADVPKSTDSTLSLGRALVVFAQLADLPPAERARRITELSVKDQGLHAQVLSLLQQQGQPAQAVRRRRRSGRIGPYRIVEFVGAGGMGEVYRAEQDEPRRAVALKLLRPGPTTAAVLRWFHREASVLARLRHPGIVQIHATGWVDGPSGSEPYLAMEFVDGEPLLQVTERLPIEQRVKLLADLCCAIDHAHRRGVIHRDLKPENVLVETGSDGPRPRVLDFGVALPITDAAATHTRSDRELAGTLGYMSPEQIDGNADVRSDVYSLGAVAYQVLSGRMPLPLRGTRLSVALERIRTLEPLRLGTIDPRLRGDLDCIVGRALAKLPDQRYQSAAALAADLRRHLARLPVLARRHTALYLFGRLLQRRLASTALVALLLLSTALGIFGTLHGLLRATDASERLAGVLARVVTHVRENLDQTAGTADSRQEMLQDCRQQLTSLAGSNPENFEIQHAFADVEELQGNLLRARGQSRAAFELRLQNHQHRRWLELRRPAPRQEHELANAGVLVGDLLKEQGDLRQAQHWYDDAHVLFAQLAAAAGDDRRAQDDLACSYHRRADVACMQNDIDQARQLLDHCREITDRLLARYSDHPATLSLLRDCLCLEAAMPQSAGQPRQRLASMLQALAVVQQLCARNPLHLGYMECRLMTATSTASLAIDLSDLACAGTVLAAAQPTAAQILHLEPNHVPGLEAVIHYHAVCADLACAGRHWCDLLPSTETALAAAMRLQLLDQSGNRAANGSGRAMDLVYRCLTMIQPGDACDQALRELLLQVLQFQPGDHAGWLELLVHAHALVTVGTPADLDRAAGELLAAHARAQSTPGLWWLAHARLLARRDDRDGTRDSLRRALDGEPIDSPVSLRAQAELAAVDGH